MGEHLFTHIHVSDTLFLEYERRGSDETSVPIYKTTQRTVILIFTVSKTLTLILAL